MPNRLACGGADIDPHVEPIGVVAFHQESLALIHKRPEVGLFGVGGLEVIREMAVGDDEQVPLGDGELVPPGVTMVAPQNDVWGQGMAERAGQILSQDS